MTTLAHVTAADNYYLLPSYDDTLRFGEHNEFFGARTIIGGALTSGGPYILDKSTIMLVEKASSTVAHLPSKQNTKHDSSTRDKKSLLLQARNIIRTDSEDNARLLTWAPPAYTDDVPPPYRATIEEELLAVSYVYLPPIRTYSKSSPHRPIFDGNLHGVREHAKKTKPTKRAPVSSGSKKDVPAEGSGKSSTPTKDSKSLGGASNGGDEEDDRGKKREEAQKKQDEEEEIAKKKQEREEAARIKEEEEAAAAAAIAAVEEEKRAEEERRAADEIANADPWGDELEENSRSGWGFSLTGNKKKPAKTARPAPVPVPVLVPKEEPVAVEQVLVVRPGGEVLDKQDGAAEVAAEELEESPKERQRRERREKREEKLLKITSRLGKTAGASCKEKEELVESHAEPTPKGPAVVLAEPPVKQEEESGEVTSPKIDVDEIDDIDENASPINKDAPKISGFGGISAIGARWGGFGLGLNGGGGWGKWTGNTNSSTAALETALPTGPKKSPTEEVTGVHFPETKKEIKRGITEVPIEPEPKAELELRSTGDEVAIKSESVVVASEGSASPANIEEDNSIKIVKKGKKVERGAEKTVLKNLKVKALEKVPEKIKKVPEKIEKVPEERIENVLEIEKVPEKKAERGLERLPQKILETKKVSEKKAEKTPEKEIEKVLGIEKVPEKKAGRVSERKIERIPEKKIEKVLGGKTGKVPEKDIEKVPEKKVGRGLERLPQKALEAKIERVSEKKVEKMPEKDVEKVLEIEKVPEKKAGRILERVPQRVLEIQKVPEKKVGRIPEKKIEKASEMKVGKVPGKGIEGREGGVEKVPEEKVPEEKVEEVPGKEIEKVPEKKTGMISGGNIEKAAEKRTEKVLEIEKIPEKAGRVSEKKVERIPERKTERVLEKKMGKVSEKVPQRVSEKGIEKTSEKAGGIAEKRIERVLEKKTGKVPDKVLQKTSEKAERIPEKRIEKSLVGEIEEASEKKAEKAPEKNPEKISEKKTGRVPEKRIEKVTEKKVEKRTGKVASLTGAFEQRVESVRKAEGVVEKPKSKPASVTENVSNKSLKPEPESEQVIKESPAKEPRPTPVEEREEKEDGDGIFYGPGYEKIKQRKYVDTNTNIYPDTSKVKYADTSNIGYVPTPNEPAYMPVPKEPQYAPVPEGPKYAHPKQYEYAVPSNRWGFGKNKTVKNSEAPAPPAPGPTAEPSPALEPEQTTEISEPKPEPKFVFEPEPEPEPESVPVPVKPTKKKGWFYKEPEADSEPEPALVEPPIEDVAFVEETIEVVEAVPEPELEFVEAHEVVEAEPESKSPLVIEAEPALVPSPGLEPKRAKKDHSVWSLLAAPKPKKRITVPERKERRPSIEIDSNGSPVRVIGIRELWKMNKELEKKKKNAKITLSTEKSLDDVAPDSPAIEAEVNSANHEDAAWIADVDVPLSPPPPMLPIEAYLVPDTPIAAQAPQPVWHEVPTPPVFVSAPPKSSLRKGKRTQPIAEPQTDRIIEEPGPRPVGPEPELKPELVKREKKQKKGWGFFEETVSEPEPEPVVGPELETKPIVESEPESEPEPARPTKKDTKKKKKGWFFEPEAELVTRESEPIVDPEPEVESEPEPESTIEPEPGPARPGKTNKKKGWFFGEVAESTPESASEPEGSESVPELEHESTDDPELELELSASTPEPSDPEPQFEEAQEEALTPAQLATEWPEDKVQLKGRRHSRKYQGVGEGVPEVKDKEKRHRRNNLIDTSVVPSKAPSMERRETMTSDEGADKATRRERRRQRKFAEEQAEQEMLRVEVEERLRREAEERQFLEKEQRRAEKRAKKAKREAELKAKELTEREALAREAGRKAREEALAPIRPKMERRKSKRHSEVPAEETREEREARRESRRARKAAKNSSPGTGSLQRSNRNSVDHAARLSMAMNSIPDSNSDPYTPDRERSDPYEDTYEQEAKQRRRRERHNARKAQKAGLWTNGEDPSGSVTPEQVPRGEDVTNVRFSSSISNDLQEEQALRERRRKRKEARRNLNETPADEEEVRRLRKLQKKEEKRVREVRDQGPKGINDPEARAARRLARAKRRADSERFNGALTENEGGTSKGSWWKKLMG